MDARAMFERNRLIGAVYMAGYAIECSLKGLLHAERKRFPTSGREGHDLRALWLAAGFRLSDLRDDANGAKTFYVQTWSTDMRYEMVVSSPLTGEELLSGATALTGWIQTRAKRPRRRR